MGVSGASSANLIAAIALVSGLSESAMAYVGPGAGVTMLGALWAVLVAIVFVIGGLLVWPIRSLLKNNRRKDRADSGNGEDTVATVETYQDAPDAECTAELVHHMKARK